MGLLKRLFGEREPKQRSTLPSKNTQISVAIWSADHTRGDAGVEVVGEQYHAEAVELFKRHAGSASADAVLMRQPDNPKDSNAVAVMVYTQTDPPQAALVGYLTRDDAAAYRPVFDHLADRIIGCEAAVAPYRGGAGTDGVVLHLGTPGELVAELWIEDNGVADHRWKGATVAFSGFGVSIAGVNLDRDGQAMLARLSGCDVVPRMSKRVQLLVVNDPGESTEGVAKARAYGCEMIDEIGFWTALGIEPTLLGKGLGRWAQPRSRSWA